jgi:hypothetical protein
MATSNACSHLVDFVPPTGEFVAHAKTNQDSVSHIGIGSCSIIGRTKQKTFYKRAIFQPAFGEVNLFEDLDS